MYGMTNSGTDLYLTDSYRIRKISSSTGTAPAITINSVAATTKTTSVTLALSASDPSGVAKMTIGNTSDLSDGTEETYATTKTWTLTTGDGTKTVYVKFKDTLGNWSSVYSASITLDSTAPITIITAKPPATDTNRSATFSFSSEAGATFQCQLDSEAFSACTSPKTYTNLTPGSHTFTVKASDTIGNIETVSTQDSWQWTIATLLTITKNGTGKGTVSTTSGTINWNGNSGAMVIPYNNQLTLTTASDPGSTLTAWGGSCSGTGDCILTMDGDKNVTATFNDTTAPVVSITFPANGSYQNEVFDLDANGTDNMGVASLEFSVYFTSSAKNYYLNSTASTFSFVPEVWIPAVYEPTGKYWYINTLGTPWLDGRAYTIRARSTDLAGNVSYPVSLTFTKGIPPANQAPTITQGSSVNVSMSKDGSPTPFALTLNASDANNDTITWSISSAASHGTAAASGTGTSKAIGYTPTANYTGSDSFVVQASDGNGGTASITINVSIFVNGTCGSSNSGTFTVTPTSNLCTSGTASTVTGTGPWNWNCAGLNNGTTATCSAAITSYSVTFASDANGTLTGSANQTVNYGASATAITAVPKTGYHFVNWTGNGFTTTTSNPLTVSNVTAALSITANFAIDSVNGSCGSSSGQTLITVPSTNLCTAGTASTVTDSGPWNWTCSGSNGGTSSNCSAAIQTNSISISKSGSSGGSVTSDGGSISWVGSGGSAAYNYGTVITLTATPDSGNIFTGWTGDCSGTGTCQVTMSTAKSVAAVFAPAPSFSITSGAISVVQGDTRQAIVTLTATNNFNTPVAITWSTLPGGATAVITTSPVTPTASGSSAIFSITAGSTTPIGASTVRLTATGGGVTKTFDVPVTVAAPLAITTTSLTAGLKGQAYSGTIATTGGIGTLVFTRTTGSLPDGLSLSSSGVLSGTPTTKGSFTFTIKVQDGDDHSTSAQYTMKISDPNYRALVLTATGWTLQKGVSGILTAKVIDDSGNDAPVSTNTNFTILSTSTAGRFSLDDFTYNSSNTATLTIPTGFNAVEFFYKDTTVGVATLTASGKTSTSSAAWDSGSHTITIAAPGLISTVITAGVSSATYGQSVTVTGTLKDASSVALAGKNVCFIFSTPVQTQTSENCAQTSSSGSYSYIADTSYINQAGSWSVNASFKGDSSYNAVTTITPFTIAKADTTIQLTLDNLSISPNGSLTATGKASSTTVTDLSNISIAVDFIDPDGTAHTITATLTGTLGHYTAKYSQFSGKEGIWKIKARVINDTNYNGIESELKNVTVANAAGYAILIEGDNNGQYRAHYTASLDDIRAKLLSRSFTDDTIQYLSYETGHAGVDGATTKANIQSAITTWALSKIKQYGVAPLYIIMMDHGGQGGKFYIQQPGDAKATPQFITPGDLNGWLTSLEGNVKTDLGKELTTVVINGSCYSGSFISELSKKNRVIIASSSQGELSAQGPSFNQKTYGEYFIYYLFNSLTAGETVGKSFSEAAELTQQLRKCNTAACRQNGVGMGDDAAQHPLMDDNGDGAGSPLLTIGQNDGSIADKMRLGLGSNASGVVWQGIMPTGKIAQGTASTTVWAAIDLTNTASSWIEIRRPDYLLPDDGGTGQVSMNLPVISGTPNQGSGRFEYLIQPDLSKGFSGLDIPGAYTLYYYATNLNGDIIPPVIGTLYVENSGNHTPNDFTLTTPASGDEIDSSLLLFRWNETTDLDGDQVTYTLKIYDDNNNSIGTTAAQLYELIPQGAYLLDSTQAKRADGTPLFVTGNYYWWEVIAVDSKGASKSGGANRFRTIFANGLPGIVKGYLRSTAGTPVIGATVNIGSTTSTTLSNGSFYAMVPTGSYNVTVTAATGYKLNNASVAKSVAAGTVVDASMSLTQLDATNGACGASDKGIFTTMPTSSLCNAGTGSSVTENGSGHQWSWSCNGSNGGTNAACYADIQSYTVSFSADSGGSLSGTSSQKINHGASTAAVTAVASSGYHFVSWSGTGGFVTTTTNPLTVSAVTASMTITATFAADPINGICGSDNSKTMAVIPTNLCSSGSASTVTGSGPWSWSCQGLYSGTSQNCSANLLTYAISTTLSDANGTITCQSSVPTGGSSVCSITPNSGYHTASFTVGGVDHLADISNNSYTITNITANQSVVGSFAITQQAQTITFTPPATKTYGDPAITLTATGGASGNPVTFTLVSGPATLSGSTLTITGPGTIVIKASQTGNSNYANATDVTANIVVAKAALSITAVAKSKTYGTSDPVFTYTTAGLISPDTMSGSLTRTAGEAVGSYPITQGTVTVSAPGNYNISYTGADLTIGKATPTIIWSTPADITYGTALSGTQLNATSGGVAGTFVYTPAAGTVLSAGSAQQLSVTFTPSDSNSYNTPAATTTTINVSTKALTIIANNISRAYGTANPTTPGFTAPALVGSDSIGSVSYTYATTATATAAVGSSHAITPSNAVFTSGTASNYNITYTAGTLTIAGGASQSITFNPPTTATYGDPAITLSATATSGLPVTFTLVSGPATLTGSTLTITGSGTITVRATQGGDSTYAAATDVQKTISVTNASYTVTGNTSGNGSIQCITPVTSGNTTTCTLTPDTGYKISAASGCGTGSLGGTTYTTGAISASCTVSATFAAQKAGDCDNNGTVTIAEVQSAINMFLGLKTVEACVDVDSSNSVSIAEVQKVINSFLGL